MTELHNFVELANTPIFGVDRTGLINEWNLKATTATGWLRADVVGKPFVDLCVRQGACMLCICVDAHTTHACVVSMSQLYLYASSALQLSP